MSCRLRLVAGEVEVRLEHPAHDGGRCPLPARASALLAVATASVLTQGVADPPEPDRPPMGFTAAIERAEPVDLTPGWYDDEE